MRNMFVRVKIQWSGRVSCATGGTSFSLGVRVGRILIFSRGIISSSSSNSVFGYLSMYVCWLES